LTKKLNKGNNMPNWTNNCLCIEGDEAKIQDFINKVKTDSQELDEDCDYAILNNLFPTPTDIGDGWYEWNIENWGTKWADKETFLVIRDNGYAYFRFDTAWSPPVEGIGHISVMFPDLTFTLTYTEEGMGFAGCAGYKDGVMVHAQSEEMDIDENLSGSEMFEAISQWWQDKADECEVHVRGVLNALPLETINN
jgi:hypothetical protein